MKIAIGADHAGYSLKEYLKSQFRDIDWIDKGTYSDESVDYPDFAHLVSESVLSHKVDFGILICGSGNGISIAANKHQGIRAAIAWLPELAALARQHNDANVLSLPARFITESQATNIVEVFLSTSFEGGRHQKRIDKIDLQ